MKFLYTIISFIPCKMCVCLYRELIKRDPTEQNDLSDAVKPLFRLLRLQNVSNTTDQGSNTARTRVR